MPWASGNDAATIPTLDSSSSPQYNRLDPSLAITARNVAREQSTTKAPLLTVTDSCFQWYQSVSNIIITAMTNNKRRPLKPCAMVSKVRLIDTFVILRKTQCTRKQRTSSNSSHRLTIINMKLFTETMQRVWGSTSEVAAEHHDLFVAHKDSHRLLTSSQLANPAVAW